VGDEAGRHKLQRFGQAGGKDGRTACALGAGSYPEISEKGKAPPTLIENRELGLFFVDGQLLCDQRSNGGFAGHQLLDITT
jgi:hypothetical protein